VSDEPVAFRVVRGNPTPEELAAVTAVLSAAVEELADDNARVSVTETSAWSRSQRSLRGPLVPGNGAWRGFSG
jgi:hypothetical protein